MKEFTPNGIEYTWDLVGAEGASFTLFPSPTDTPEMIKVAKNYLCDTQDVVHLNVASEADRDYKFKSDYFRDPRTRSLKWYEIEQDVILIRTARLKGLTPEDFVTQFVLPCVEKVKKSNLEKFGEKIFSF